MNTQSSDLVSIAITTFNHARFLGEAIASCMGQPSVAEVIVVDDESADDPADVVRAFPSVQMITQARQGLSAARNLALRMSIGKFIVYLDADDRLLPNAVSSNLRCFESHPDAGLVYGAYRTINQLGQVLKAPDLLRVSADPYRTLLYGNRIGMHGTVMYRRDCLLAVGGFDPSLKSCEDYDVYLRIARAFPIACTSDAIAEYRQHDMQKSRDCTRVLGAALAILVKCRRLDDPKNNWLYKDASTAWKRWYATRHADRLIHSIRRGTLSNQLMIETIKMLPLAPLALLNALRSISKAKRRLGVSPNQWRSGD